MFRVLWFRGFGCGFHVLGWKASFGLWGLKFCDKAVLEASLGVLEVQVGLVLLEGAVFNHVPGRRYTNALLPEFCQLTVPVH